MKPLAVVLSATFMTVSVQALALRGGPAEVKLPVFKGEISFFQEGRQAIDLGPLPAGIESLSAEACASCHKAEHAEWKASAHARSVTEPVFAAAFKSEPRFLCRSCHSPMLEQHPLLMPVAGQQPAAPQPVPPVPQTAPVPTAPVGGAQPAGFAGAPAVQTLELTEALTEQQVILTKSFGRIAHGGEPNPRFQESLVAEGVNCATCHVREGTVLTANPTSKKAPHALSYSAALKTADFCGGCHQFDVKNPQVHRFEFMPVAQAQQAQIGPTPPGAQPAAPAAPKKDPLSNDDPPVPSQPFLMSSYHQEPRVQHTVDEFRLSASAAKGESCQTCHMAPKAGRATHNWPGRDNMEMLRSAVTLAARLDRPAYREGEKLQALIKLKNHSGHAFPTGDSIHAGILDVWLRDGEKTLGRQVYVMTGQGAGTAAQLRGGRLNQRLGQRVSGLGFGGGFAGGIAGGLGGMPNGGMLEGPSGADTRLLPGEEATLVFSQVIAGDLAKAKSPVLRLRVFHSAIHPGFKGTPIDPALSPLRLVREENLPVKLVPKAVTTALAGRRPGG